MTLVGNVGRWHGSTATAGPDVLRLEISNEERAILRIQATISEHQKLLAEHRRLRRNLQRRLNRRTRK